MLFIWSTWSPIQCCLHKGYDFFCIYFTCKFDLFGKYSFSQHKCLKLKLKSSCFTNRKNTQISSLICAPQMSSPCSRSPSSPLAQRRAARTIATRVPLWGPGRRAWWSYSPPTYWCSPHPLPLRYRNNTQHYRPQHSVAAPTPYHSGTETIHNIFFF